VTVHCMLMTCFLSHTGCGSQWNYQTWIEKAIKSWSLVFDDSFLTACLQFDKGGRRSDIVGGDMTDMCTGCVVCVIEEEVNE